MRGRNLKATVAYDGSDFHGWQVQPELRTVQGALEEALSRLLNEEIRIAGAGRTDKGVHALGQVFNFATCRDVPVERILLSLNRILPGDIFIRDLVDMSAGFHARFSATSRSYRYQLGLWKKLESPLTNRFAWYPGVALDFRAMEKASRLLPGKRDFRAFAKQAELDGDTTCELLEASWRRCFGGYAFQVTANRFLPSMVRRILAVLLDVGSKRIDASSVEDLLAGRAGCPNRPWLAPPQGLCLMNVNY